MALIALVLLAGVLAAIVMIGAGGGPAPLAPVSAADDVHAVLVSRFIDRSMRFRRSGALAGLVVLVAVVLVRAATSDAVVRFDLLTLASIGLGGSIVGSIAAEGFRLRRPTGPRTATLEVRSALDYADPVSDRREGAIAGLAVIGIVGSLAAGAAEVRAVLLGLGVAVLAGIRRWAIRRIALRPRPPLTEDLRQADDALRRLAASVGLSRPMVALAALLVAAQWGAVSTGAALGRPGTATDVIRVAAWIGSVAAFLVALRWWWVNRSFGLLANHPAAPATRQGIVRVALIVVGLLAVATALVVVGRGA